MADEPPNEDDKDKIIENLVEKFTELKREKEKKDDRIREKEKLIEWFVEEDTNRNELLEAQENEIKALKRDNERKEDEFKKLKEHLQKAEEEAEEMRKLAQNAFVAGRNAAKKTADRWSVGGTSPTASSLSRRSSFGSSSSVPRKSAEPSAKKAAPIFGHVLPEICRWFDGRRDSGMSSVDGTLDPRTIEELEQYNDNGQQPKQQFSLHDELEQYSNDKPGEELEQYSNDKPGEELEQYSNDKPGEELEQYSNDKPGEELEQYSNDKPGEELEQYSNDKPGEELEQYNDNNNGWVQQQQQWLSLFDEELEQSNDTDGDQQQQGEKSLFDELKETEEQQNSNDNNHSTTPNQTGVVEPSLVGDDAVVVDGGVGRQIEAVQQHLPAEEEQTSVDGEDNGDDGTHPPDPAPSAASLPEDVVSVAAERPPAAALPLRRRRRPVLLSLLLLLLLLVPFVLVPSVLHGTLVLRVPIPCRALWLRERVAVAPDGRSVLGVVGTGQVMWASDGIFFGF
ncbi:hypothetical protein niasHT_009406 [Heterodera trifolii]|uniref:Uncharacterized protein n=1 Tax=Heterodera trifolii TaxID=157864 RepID=A0ABD2M4R3_9BILA